MAVLASRTMLSTFCLSRAVGGVGLERQLLRRLGGLDAREVDEERVQPRPGEDPQARPLGGDLAAPERDLLSAG
jgi:hypothetical protein